jgi:hypothetical protein
LRFHAFHGLPDNEELLQYGRIDGTAALRLDAAGPYDACEIQAGNGHRWPDSLRGHSPVELPFSPRASRYFDDRATARDLALFVRSKRMHELRKLTGPRLAAALAATYRGAIARGEPSATGRIGYLLGPNGVTFVERSPTGRRFFVRFQAGRLAGQNLKPLAFPF